MRKTDIRNLANNYGWEEKINYPNIALVFKKGNVRIYIWHKSHEIETEIYHPKSKRHTNLIRPDYTPELLESIFHNPRAHTGVGKYQSKHGITKKPTT